MFTSQPGGNNFPTPTNTTPFDPFSGDPFVNTTQSNSGFDDAFATNWGDKVCTQSVAIAT